MTFNLCITTYKSYFYYSVRSPWDNDLLSFAVSLTLTFHLFDYIELPLEVSPLKNTIHVIVSVKCLFNKTYYLLIPKLNIINLGV